jgi:hypothetical protein
MTSLEVDQRLREIQRTIEGLDLERAYKTDVSEGIRDLSSVVDNLRHSLWAVLQAENAHDLAGFIGRVRVRRANQICKDVLADLRANSVPRDMPGLRVLEATLEELAKSLPDVAHE